MKNQSIKKNYFYNMLYQLLIMILPFITAPYLSRVVGADGIGIYSYRYSIAQYFVFFSMLGISNLGNRSIAKIRDDISKRNSTFSKLFSMQLLTCTIFSILYILYCIFFVNEYKIIALIQIIYVVSALLDISWLFFGMEDFKRTVTRQIFIKVLSTILIFVFVKSYNDIWIYTLILSLSTFLGQLFLLLSARKYVSFSLCRFKDYKMYFKPNLVLFIPIIATSIYRVMDKVMLGSMANITQVGYYENSDKIVTTCLGIIGSLGSVMLPRMTNLVAKGEKSKAREYIINSMEVTMFLACAICFGIASVSNEFIPIFYGKGFDACINITKLLTISSMFIAWANVVRMQYLIPNEKDKVYVTSIIVGAIINVFVNYILIKKYGAIGTAIGTICAELTVMMIQTISTRNQLPIKTFIKKSLPYLFFGFIMFIIVRLSTHIVSNDIISLLIEIIIGGTIYILCSFIFMYYEKNALFLNMLKKVRIIKND